MSRHRETIAERTPVYGQFRALQKQGKCASAFVADRRPTEWFWLPDTAARQPRASPETKAHSTGESSSSDVTSTTAARSTSSQPSPRDRTVSVVGVISRLRI